MLEIMVSPFDFVVKDSSCEVETGFSAPTVLVEVMVSSFDVVVEDCSCEVETVFFTSTPMIHLEDQFPSDQFRNKINFLNLHLLLFFFLSDFLPMHLTTLRLSHNKLSFLHKDCHIYPPRGNLD